MGMELRSATRAAVDYPVRLSGDAGTAHGLVLNLSAPGCAIAVDLPVQPGAYVELEVSVPDEAGPLTVGLAKVRWATRETVGLEFIRVRQDDQRRIQLLVNELLDEPVMTYGLDSLAAVR